MNQTVKSLHTLIERAQMLLRVERENIQINQELSDEIQCFTVSLTNISDMILFAMNSQGDGVMQLAALNGKTVEETRRQIESGRLLAGRYDKRRLMPALESTPQLWGAPASQMQIQANFAFPVDHLGLSSRVNNTLISAGVGTIGYLLTLTELQLSQIPNLGTKSIREIVHRLMQRGLALRKN